MDNEKFNQSLKDCRHKKNNGSEMFWLSLLLVLVFLVTAFLIWNNSWLPAWIVMIIGLLVFIALQGKYSLCRPMGIFINERNQMSLSRLQIVLWTIIIVSAYSIMVFARIRTGVENPFDIAIDWHIWAVLGLTTTAAVGASFINSSKGLRQPVSGQDPPKGMNNLSDVSSVVRKAASAFNQEPDEVEQTRTGILYANPDPKFARFSDIFEGEELSNSMYIDIAKVQMFWFSLIAIVCYAGFLINLFLISDPQGMNAFPAFSDGFLAILAVSHAAYLGGKGVTHTPSA
jgi:hypothetical protein